jgi:hypothetical protein
VLNSHPYGFLATPVLGSATPAGFTEVIAALLLADNPKMGEEAFAEAAWRLLEQHRRRLVKNGVTVDGKEASVEELKAVHAAFMAGKSALWKRLGVLP